MLRLRFVEHQDHERRNLRLGFHAAPACHSFENHHHPMPGHRKVDLRRGCYPQNELEQRRKFFQPLCRRRQPDHRFRLCQCQGHQFFQRLRPRPLPAFHHPEPRCPMPLRAFRFRGGRSRRPRRRLRLLGRRILHPHQHGLVRERRRLVLPPETCDVLLSVQCGRRLPVQRVPGQNGLHRQRPGPRCGRDARGRRDGFLLGWPDGPFRRQRDLRVHRRTRLLHRDGHDGRHLRFGSRHPRPNDRYHHLHLGRTAGVFLRRDRIHGQQLRQ